MARCSLAGGSMPRPRPRLGDEEEVEADWREGLVIGRSGWKGTGLAGDDVEFHSCRAIKYSIITIIIIK